MSGPNAWSRGPDSQQDEDVEVEVETVEAERVLTLVELAGRPIADQLAALQGSPIKPLTTRRSSAGCKPSRAGTRCDALRRAHQCRLTWCALSQPAGTR